MCNILTNFEVCARLIQMKQDKIEREKKQYTIMQFFMPIFWSEKKNIFSILDGGTSYIVYTDRLWCAHFCLLLLAVDLTERDFFLSSSIYFT